MWFAITKTKITPNKVLEKGNGYFYKNKYVLVLKVLIPLQAMSTAHLEVNQHKLISDVCIRSIYSEGVRDYVRVKQSSCFCSGICW